MSRKRVSRHCAAAASALVFAALVVWTASQFGGIDALVETFRRVPASAWRSFAFLIVAAFTLRALRLWRMLRDVDARVGFASAAAIFFAHNMSATLVPARAGEAAFPLLAKRWAGIDWAAAVGVLAWWRVVDLAVGSAIALALLGLGSAVLAPLLGMALASCTLPLVLFATRARFVRYVDRHATPLPERPRGIRFAHRIASGMPPHFGAATADVLLALAGWSVKLAAFGSLVLAALAAYPTGPIAVDWPFAAAAALAGDAGGALPIPALGGVGPFEGAVTLALTSVRVDPAAALAAGVVLHAALLVSVVVTGAGGFALGLWQERARSMRATDPRDDGA